MQKVQNNYVIVKLIRFKSIFRNIFSIELVYFSLKLNIFFTN